MVSSIVSGASASGALAVDPRLARGSTAQAGGTHRPAGDTIDISAASLSAARDSVGEALNQVHRALGVGHDAQATLLKIDELLRAGGDGAQLESVLADFAARVDQAIAEGARLVAGEDLEVVAEPGGSPLQIAGASLRPGEGVITASSGQLSRSEVQRSLELLQAEQSRFLEGARALEAHQGFLGAVEEAGGRGGLDADSARLLALQVRQGLEAAGAVSIANVEPQAVLSLFRA